MLSTIVDTSDFTMNIVDDNTDMRDHDTQVDIIGETFKDSAECDSILALHKDYMTECANSVRQTWRLLYLQWSNIYKYQEYSYIDFREVDGISVLYGENAVGKSSIINMLIYILFGGKVGQNSGLNREFILNYNNDHNGHIKCCIAHENDEYIIERIIKRANTKDDIKLWKNGEIMEEGDIPKTYATFESIVGSRDDFLAMPVASQFAHHL